MTDLAAFNLFQQTPTSGSWNVGNISQATASFIGSGSFGLTWGYEVCAINGYVFVTDSFTQSYAPSSSGNPIFYVATTTGSSDVLNVINGLPDRRNYEQFTYINTALGWVSGSQKYITLYTCSILEYPFNLLQEDGNLLLQENLSNIILNY